jgi:hypothetical protein
MNLGRLIGWCPWDAESQRQIVLIARGHAALPSPSCDIGLILSPR